MATLELRKPDGTTERHELSRSQPVSIGRQSFNEICIDEPDVAPMHCRISYNRNDVEVTSVATEGVLVNKRSVKHATLSDGDTIQVGRVAIVFFRKSPKKLEAVEKRQEARSESRLPEPDDGLDEPVSVSDLSLYSGEVDLGSRSEDSLSEFSGKAISTLRSLSDPAETKKSRKGQASRPVRPGEQEIAKSPLVLSLAGGGALLLLVSGIVWFLMAREQTNQLFQSAKDELAASRYSQSITLFEQFLQKYPRHSLAREAVVSLGQAKIQRDIAGASPAWKRGMEQLSAFVSAHKDEKYFSTTLSDIRTFAEQIARGAAITAETSLDKSLLDVSASARELLERYQDPTNPPTVALEKIATAAQKARQTIRKQEQFTGALAEMDAALGRNQPVEALALRQTLVSRFPEFQQSPQLLEAVQKSLALATSSVTGGVVDGSVLPEVGDSAWSRPVFPIAYIRARTEDSSVGRRVFAMARDSLYALDSVTGDVVWRAPLGVYQPFAPVAVDGQTSGLLVYRSGSSALALLERATGKTLWQHALGAAVTTPPLVLGEMVYAVLSDQRLVALDVGTGQMVGELRFAQPIASGPTLLPDGARLLLVGEANLLYQVQVRPFAAESVTFTAHAPDTIVAPPLAMGPYVLVCENFEPRRTRLRVFQGDTGAGPLPEKPGEVIDGPVRESPEIRGPQLVIPSRGEKLAAFLVADEPGQPVLRPAGNYQTPAGTDGPVFVAMGPQNQFWVQGSAFRRFELTPDGIRLDQSPVAPGRALQPLQLVDEQYFLARRQPASDAVVVSPVDRDKLTVPWRTILGAGTVAAVASGPNVVSVTEAGYVFSISRNRLVEGGAEARQTAELALPPSQSGVLLGSVAADGSLIVAAVAEGKAQAWVVSSAGQSSGPLALKGVPVIAPVGVGPDIVFARSDGLSRRSIVTNSVNTEDWSLPPDLADRQWLSLVATGRDEFVASTRFGELLHFELRETPTPHLKEVARLAVATELGVPPIFADDDLLVASPGKLERISVRGFHVSGQLSFEGTPVAMGVAANLVLMTTLEGELLVVRAGETLEILSRTRLANFHAAGEPVAWKDWLLWAGRGGEVLGINQQTGAIDRQIAGNEAFGAGLLLVEDGVVGLLLDGSAVLIDPTWGATP